jgi:three-Cys-motif partner protein
MSPRRARGDEYALAQDGMVARRNGAWAKDKLSFLDEFIPPALQATTRKKERCYVDLFAGPGINIDDDGVEFEGAALRVLRASAQSNAEVGFTHAKLVNLDDEADTALRARVENYCADGRCLVPHASVEFFKDDANVLVHAIMRRIKVKAYVFVFADIERPNQLPFDTIRALKMHRHESVDFCVLFPGDMALNRMLPYDWRKLQPNVPALDRFFGTTDWMTLWKQRKTEAQSAALYLQIQQLYEHQLRSQGWEHVVETRYVRRTGDAGLYKLLLASDHAAAEKFATWSARKQRRREVGRDLFE